MIQSIDLRRQRDLQLAIDQVLVQLRDQQRHDPPQVVVGQRLEDDDFVDAVDELGVERALDLAEHHVRDALVDRRPYRTTGSPSSSSSG